MRKYLQYITAAVIIVLLGISVSVFVKNSEENTSEAEELLIKIGVIAPMSGDVAAYGEQIQRVIDYRLDHINQKSKDMGYTFEVVYEDGKCSGDDAVSAFQKLTDIDGVKFIVGGACSSETLAIVPLSKEKSVLTISTTSSNPDIDGASPYSFTFSYDDDVVAQSLAREMSSYKRIAIISEQDDYAIGLQKEFELLIREHPDTEIVANEVFPRGNVDFRSLLEKVKNTNPDAILLNPHSGVTTETLVRQLAEIKDWDGYQLFGQYAFMTETVLSIASEITDGMIIADAPLIVDEGFVELMDIILVEKGSLEDLGAYYVASTLDVVDTLTTLIIENGEEPTQVRDALTSGEFELFIGDSINFRESSFPNVGGAVYIVKDNNAVIRE